MILETCLLKSNFELLWFPLWNNSTIYPNNNKEDCERKITSKVTQANCTHQNCASNEKHEIVKPKLNARGIGKSFKKIGLRKSYSYTLYKALLKKKKEKNHKN